MLRYKEKWIWIKKVGVAGGRARACSRHQNARQRCLAVVFGWMLPRRLFLFTSVREGKRDERKLSSKPTFMNQKFIGVTRTQVRGSFPEHGWRGYPHHRKAQYGQIPAAARMGPLHIGQAATPWSGPGVGWVYFKFSSLLQFSSHSSTGKGFRLVGRLDNSNSGPRSLCHVTGKTRRKWGSGW